MPEIEALCGMPWGAATPVEAAVALPWGAAGIVESLGGPYVAPPAPPGGVEVEPGDLTPGAEIAEAASYDQVHTLVVTDLRDGAVLAVDQVTMDLQDGSVFWTLNASGAGELFDVLTEGDQPATVEVNISGLIWRFIVEDVNRPRAFASDRVSFGGRSLAALAASPYQFEVNWLSDAPTSAAQIAAGAQTFTGLTIDWQIEDWGIPAGVLSFFGTPLAVAQYVAQAAGAVVTAHRSDLTLTVQPRYPILPNEWCSVAPDVAVAFNAVETESYVRADRPEYDAVLLAGQQQGAIGYVRIDGKPGASMAPMVTDPLLTDVAALRQRGESILGASGPQARVTRTLPVRTGAGEPGVIERGAIVRWNDPGWWWVGMVRSVNVQVRFGFAQQTLAVERHTCTGATEPTLLFEFNGPIPDIEATVGEPFSVDISGYWAEGTTPYTFSTRSGVLPPGLTLSAAGVISGTPTEVVDATYRARGQDGVSNIRDSNEFGVGVVAAGGMIVALSSTSPYGATSNDGITWTEFPSVAPTTASANVRIAQGAGVLVCTQDAKLYSSPDGITWTERHSNVGGQYSGVVWTGTEFFALKNSSSSKCARSPDGITWALTAGSPPAGARYLTWNGARLIAGQYQGTATTARIWSSEDGETWTERHVQSSWGCGALVSNGSMTVALPSVSSSTCLSSPDGITWTARALGGSGFFVDGAWGDGMFLGHGSNAGVARSSDGISWTWGSSGFGSFAPRGVCWDGTQFIVAWASPAGLVITSPDGVTWTSRTAPTQAYQALGVRS